MTQEDLRARGWLYDAGAHVYQWRDPRNLLSWYTFRDAVAIQEEREAENG